MYLGESPYLVQVGTRDVKVLDPWRVGVLVACVPGYGLYWWYRSAADLRALARESGHDNAGLAPLLMLALAVLFGSLLFSVLAVVLLSE